MGIGGVDVKKSKSAEAGDTASVNFETNSSDMSCDDDLLSTVTG